MFRPLTDLALVMTFLTGIQLMTPISTIYVTFATKNKLHNDKTEATPSNPYINQKLNRSASDSNY